MPSSYNKKITKRKKAGKRASLIAVRLFLLAFLLLLLWLISGLFAGPNKTKDTPEPKTPTLVNENAVTRWLYAGPVRQNPGAMQIAAPPYQNIALPQNGRVDMKYFADAAFLGDSITLALDYYRTIKNTTICAYEGIGPKAVYDGSFHQNQDGTYEAPLEAIKASGARNVYVLIGTNALVSMDNESIIIYYDEMLAQLKDRLDDGVNIYVQSLTPVLPGTPRFDIATIQALNHELAQLSWQHNVYFLDIYSALAGENGYMKSEYGTPDGYHINADGCKAWLEYLITHTAYSKENHPFYLEGSAPFC